jgi:hypothetical protein
VIILASRAAASFNRQHFPPIYMQVAAVHQTVWLIAFVLGRPVIER